jgi:hypothetical protein
MFSLHASMTKNLAVKALRIPATAFMWGAQSDMSTSAEGVQQATAELKQQTGLSAAGAQVVTGAILGVLVGCLVPIPANMIMG